MPNALTRALGFHPQPVPPPVIDTLVRNDVPVMDTPADNDLPVDTVKARLAELPRHRQQLAQDHAVKVEPLLKERARLEREIGSIDAQLAWAGIERQDQERELDREGARLQALLPRGGPGDGDHAVQVDELQVERTVARLKSGKLKRTEWIASTPEDEDAQLVYDGLVESISQWARQQVQTRHATGRVRDLPEEARGFNRTLLASICARQGLSI